MTAGRRLGVAVMDVLLAGLFLGDYLVYRTGVAGRLRRWLPPSAARVGRIAAALAGPGALLSTAIASFDLWRRAGVGSLSALLLAVVAVGLVAHALRCFSRAWRYVNAYRVGSAKVLVGEGVLFQVFMGTEWIAGERRRRMADLRRACDWLGQQAATRGIPLTLRTEPRYELRLASLPMPLVTAAEDAEEGMELLSAHLAALQPRIEADVRERLARLPIPPHFYCLVVHSPQAGRSFAHPMHNDLQARANPEFCVCFRDAGPTTYAHELLHLFGAPDLYFDPDWALDGATDANRAWRERVAYRGWHLFLACFHRSIMGRTDAPLPSRVIDPITARAIGWRGPDRDYYEALRQWDDAFVETVTTPHPECDPT